MSDSQIARRQFLAALGAGATLGAGMLVTSSVQADNKGTTEFQPTPLPPDIKSITGSWFGEIYDAYGNLLFRGMATFMSGGGMMTTGQNDIGPDEMRGTGHGVWRQDGRHVDNRLLKFIYNGEMQLTAIYEEFLSGDMDESGDIFNAEATVNLYDLEGNLTVTRTGSITARRLLVSETLGA